MTQPTTRLEAARARQREAEAALAAEDYSAAARDFTLAAEQLETIWHDMHGERGKSPDAQNMRRAARDAIQRRDDIDALNKSLQTRIRLEGRIGGFQN